MGSRSPSPYPALHLQQAFARAPPACVNGLPFVSNKAKTAYGRLVSRHHPWSGLNRPVRLPLYLTSPPRRLRPPLITLAKSTDLLSRVGCPQRLLFQRNPTTLRASIGMCP